MSKIVKRVIISASVIAAVIISMLMLYVFYLHGLSFTGQVLVTNNEGEAISREDVRTAQEVLYKNGIESLLTGSGEELLVLGINSNKAIDLLSDCKFESSSVPIIGEPAIVTRGDSVHA